MSTDPETVRKPTLGQRLGHAPLEAEIGKPAININEPNLLTIARAVCENLPTHTIFRREDKYFTVEQSTKPNALGLYPAVPLEMTPSRLRSWLYDYFVFHKGSGDKAKSVQLPKQITEAIMTSDPWYYSMDELETIMPAKDWPMPSYTDLLFNV